jgi:hypothetical protein
MVVIRLTIFKPSRDMGMKLSGYLERSHNEAA